MEISEVVYENKTANNSGSSIAFPSINDIQVEGDYFFEIKEVIPDNQSGYVYDDTVYYAKVTVVKAGTKFIVDSITYSET